MPRKRLRLNEGQEGSDSEAGHAGGWTDSEDDNWQQERGGDGSDSDSDSDAMGGRAEEEGGEEEESGEEEEAGGEEEEAGGEEEEELSTKEMYEEVKSIELDLDNIIQELDKFKELLGMKEKEVELLTNKQATFMSRKKWIKRQRRNFFRGTEKEKTRAVELATLIQGCGGEEGAGGEEGGGGEGGAEVFNRELAVIDEKLRKNEQSLDLANFDLHEAEKKYDSASKTNAANTERLLFTIHYMTTLLSYIGTRTSSSA